VLKSYFKIAYRNLIRHRAYSLINISGLAVGMSCVILISLFVVREFRYDTHHENSDRLYRLIREDEKGNSKSISVHSSGGEGDALSQSFPEVTSVCRIYANPVWIRIEEKGFVWSLATVDSTILEILTIPFVAGDPKTALTMPRSIVVTQKVAQQYFGDEDPIGKTLIVDHYATSGPFNISGVVKDQPVTSTISFDVLTTTQGRNHTRAWNRWDFNKAYAGGSETILQLRDGADYRKLEIQFNKLAAERNPFTSVVRYYIRPLVDIHLYLRSEFGILGSSWITYGSIDEVYAYTAIAVIILLIACVNFTKLTTARAINRAREVGLRKVSGALRGQVVFQFLGEAILLSILAFCLALLVVDLIMPTFSSLIGRNLSWGVLLDSYLLLGMLILLSILTGVLAGSYPAFYLSKFGPVDVMGSGPVVCRAEPPCAKSS
jgi:putative ABC transport system permease protein